MDNMPDQYDALIIHIAILETAIGKAIEILNGEFAPIEDIVPCGILIRALSDTRLDDDPLAENGASDG